MYLDGFLFFLFFSFDTMLCRMRKENVNILTNKSFF